MFSFLYHYQDIYRTWLVYMSTTVSVLWKAGTVYPSWSPSSSPVFWWVRVVHVFSFLCCPIICLYIVSSVLWSPCHFLIKTSQFGSFLPLVVCRRAHVLFTCVCLRVMVSNTYCVVFLFCFCLSCVACVANFSRLSIFDCTVGVLWRLFTTEHDAFVI